MVFKPGVSSRLLPRPDFWITLALALAIVGLAMPLRRQASRTATEGWIPMRNLTPQEAAAMLGHGASLTRIGGRTVDLVTSVYLVPVSSPEALGSVVRHGGKVWQPVSAGWNGYSLGYRLDRVPLERELGGRPLAAFLDAGKRARRLSFRSEWLTFYALFEVMLLWATLFLAWLIVRYLRPLPLVAPALLLLMVGFVIAVAAYAPALIDADFFFQRWAVEPIAIAIVRHGLSPLVWASALSLIALLAMGVLRLVRPARPAER
jgi:hypothetical protein